MHAPRFHSMPANTPAPLVQCSFVFQHLGRGQFKIVRAYLSEGVQKMKSSIPMLGGIHFSFVLPMLDGVAIFNFFNPSTARVLLLLMNSELALPCSVAFIFFCASHARWRCDFQLVQPLYGQSAVFMHKIRICTPMLGGARIFLCFPCSVALPFSILSTPLRPECDFCL